MSEQEAPVRKTHWKNKIVIGWVFDHDSIEPISEEVKTRFFEAVTQAFPGFVWVCDDTKLEGLQDEPNIEAVELCDRLRRLRDTRHWDMVFGFFRRSFAARFRKRPIAASSSAMDVGLLSCGTLRHHCHPDFLIDTAYSIVMHMFGHLLGLQASDNVRPQNYMREIESVADLKHYEFFNAAQIEVIRENLQAIADPRLEELGLSRKLPRFLFYLRSYLANSHEIMHSVWLSKPWKFPLRLSKLATAGFSAQFIMLLTAESWELGMAMDFRIAFSLFALSILGPFVLVVVQQNLIKDNRKAITEQQVTSDASAALTVFLGMVSTSLCFFISGLLISYLLFPHALVDSWVSNWVTHAKLQHYLSLSCLLTTVSMVIGALGAGFETTTYFRHVIFMDLELYP